MTQKVIFKCRCEGAPPVKLDVTFEPLTLTTEEMDFIEHRRAMRETLMGAAWGLPPSMMRSRLARLEGLQLSLRDDSNPWSNDDD